MYLPAYPVAFRSLRHPDFRRFFYGQAFSLVGTWIQVTAINWLVYRLTGSAAMLGLVNLIGGLAVVPFALVGGVLADRLPRRNLLIATQAAMFAQSLALAALAWSGRIAVWHVILLEVALAAAQSLDIPARRAFLMDAVGADDLSNAVGLSTTIANLGRMIGPGIAGLIVAAIGEAAAFSANALTFLGVIAGLLVIQPIAPPKRERKTVAADVGEGIRFLLKQPTLQALLGLVGVSSFLSMPYLVLMPVFAKDVLAVDARPVTAFFCDGAQAWFDCRSPEAIPFGLLMGAAGLGSLIGALTVASLPAGASRGRRLTLGNLLFPIALLIFAASRSFVLSVAVLVVAGFASILQNALANTLLQLLVPDILRGRIMSLYTIVFQGMVQVGGLQAGLMAEYFAAPPTVAVGAAASLAFAVWVLWRRPALRRL